MNNDPRSDLATVAPISTTAEPRTAHRFSWRVVLCAALAGVAAGFMAASSAPAAALPRDSAHGLPSGAAGTASTPLSLEAWLAMAAATDGELPGPAVRQALARSLATSQSLRREVLRRYGREPQGPVRVVMRETLPGTGPEILGAALELVQQGDSAARAAGFELLARLEPDDRSYALARRAVAIESEPAVLAGALQALRSTSLPSNTDTDAVLPRLVELSHHSDPPVRAHAIQQLAEWDKVGDRALPIVVAALSDADGLVRKAAVGAVMVGELRSGDLKRALLLVIGTAAEDVVTRGAALLALERFPLGDEELAQYRKARIELESTSVKNVNR